MSPSYKYRCKHCKAYINIFHKINEPKEIICPKCNVAMNIEVQPVQFRIGGKYTAENGYSGQIVKEDE